MLTFLVVFEWKKIRHLPTAKSIPATLCLFHSFTVCFWIVFKRLKADT